MVDENQTVMLKFGAKNQARYMALGYPKLPFGTWFEVKYKDIQGLPKTRIVVNCDYCGKPYDTNYDNYNRKTRTNTLDACKDCFGKLMEDVRARDVDERAEKAFQEVDEVLKKFGGTAITKKEEYTDVYMSFKYTCPKHGEKEVKLIYFTTSEGCPECTSERIGMQNRLTPDQVENIINQNGNILLNKEDYISNSTTNLRIVCPCGNIYTTNLATYVGGHKTRCSECSNKESNGEYAIRMWLEKNNISFYQEYRFFHCRDKNPLPFDFYLPQYNMCIEFDGYQHFAPVYGQEYFETIQRHDKIKNNFCKINNIGLTRIRYDEYDEIEKILNNAIKSCKRYSLVS